MEGIVKECICLHNYLKQTDNAGYVPAGFIHSEDSTGNIVDGSWRSVVQNEGSAFQPIDRMGSNNFKKESKEIREKFMNYFNSSEGSVPWKLNHVRSTGNKLE